MSELQERVYTNLLLDFYGPLLTENRREALTLYCEEDLSLGEIAEQLGITRQGVSDAVGKARRQLIEYEEKLGLARRARQTREKAEKALKLLDAMEDGETVSELKKLLTDIIQIER